MKIGIGTGRLLKLRDKWRQVVPGMTLEEVEEVMGFTFRLDSEAEEM